MFIGATHGKGHYLNIDTPVAVRYRLSTKTVYLSSIVPTSTKLRRLKMIKQRDWSTPISYSTKLNSQPLLIIGVLFDA